jgi:hypothetical protein
MEIVTYIENHTPITLPTFKHPTKVPNISKFIDNLTSSTTTPTIPHPQFSTIIKQFLINIFIKYFNPR